LSKEALYCNDLLKSIITVTNTENSIAHSQEPATDHFYYLHVLRFSKYKMDEGCILYTATRLRKKKEAFITFYRSTEINHKLFGLKKI